MSMKAFWWNQLDFGLMTPFTKDQNLHREPMPLQASEPTARILTGLAPCSLEVPGLWCQLIPDVGCVTSCHLPKLQVPIWAA